METTPYRTATAPAARMTPARALLLGFAGVILAGAGLLTLPLSSASGESAGFLTALFTATSAVCVTGLVVVDTGTYWSAWGQLVIMVLIQTGGLSFMAMASLFFLLMESASACASASSFAKASTNSMSPGWFASCGRS